MLFLHSVHEYCYHARFTMNEIQYYFVSCCQNWELLVVEFTDASNCTGNFATANRCAACYYVEQVESHTLGHFIFR